MRAPRSSRALLLLASLVAHSEGGTFLIWQVTAALFSGNAIVIKLSEHAAWSCAYYTRLINACLAAAGAPTDLVQLLPGYAAAGSALTRECDLMTFVGSTKVGKMVMAEASKTLTPVILELGGKVCWSHTLCSPHLRPHTAFLIWKDPFVLLEGSSPAAVADTAARGGWGSSGQNCIGAERFFVHTSLVEDFSSRLVSIASKM